MGERKPRTHKGHVEYGFAQDARSVQARAETRKGGSAIAVCVACRCYVKDARLKHDRFGRPWHDTCAILKGVEI